MPAVQIRIVAAQVLNIRVRLIPASGEGQRELRRQRQRVGREQPGRIGIRADIESLVWNEDPGVRDRLQVVLKRGRLHRGIEPQAAAKVLGAYHELVLHAPQRVAHHELHGAPIGSLVAMTDVVDGIVVGGDRIAVLVQLRITILVTEDIVIFVACLGVRGVPVVRHGVDDTVVDVERELARLGEAHTALQTHDGHRVRRLIGCGEDAGVVLCKLLNGGCAVADEIRVPTTGVQIERCIIPAPRQGAVEIGGAGR